MLSSASTSSSAHGRSTGIVSTLREGYGMVIESPQLVTLMTMMWRALWAVAKPP